MSVMMMNISFSQDVKLFGHVVFGYRLCINGVFEVQVDEIWDIDTYHFPG